MSARDSRREAPFWEGQSSRDRSGLTSGHVHEIIPIDPQVVPIHNRPGHSGNGADFQRCGFRCNPKRVYSSCRSRRSLVHHDVVVGVDRSAAMMGRPSREPKSESSLRRQSYLLLDRRRSPATLTVGIVGTRLDLHQPNPNQPDQFLGTCPGCGRWYSGRGEARGRSRQVIQLPEVREITPAPAPPRTCLPDQSIERPGVASLRAALALLGLGRLRRGTALRSACPAEAASPGRSRVRVAAPGLRAVAGSPRVRSSSRRSTSTRATVTSIRSPSR